MTREQMIDEAVRFSLSRMEMNRVVSEDVRPYGPVACSHRGAVAKKVRTEFKRITEEQHDRTHL